ncbi:MAG: CoA ester lyase [Rhodococcus sp. (in: high G+C Gram-positive bacteria)]|nr:MAG: CoA ester lyase [Rhodococcus sp. (in: high G+C Gram-positive bacteria)]
MTTSTTDPAVRQQGRIGAAAARSWLLVPADKPHRFADAEQVGADALILDLEDGVAAPNKPQARRSARDWLDHGGHAWVRINSVDETEHWRRDLTALDGAPGLLGIVLAKTENASHVDVTAAHLPAGTPVIAMIESAAGLDHSRAIAADDATARLAFGVGDYRRDTGIGADPLALAHPRSVLTHHSRLAGIAAPIDGPTPEIDLARLRTAMAETAAMGHTGPLCLQPEQVPVINAELSPSQQDLGWAERTVTELGHDGAHIRDGSDLPTLARAKKLLHLGGLFGLTPTPDACDHRGPAEKGSGRS